MMNERKEKNIEISSKNFGIKREIQFKISQE